MYLRPQLDFLKCKTIKTSLASIKILNFFLIFHICLIKENTGVEIFILG